MSTEAPATDFHPGDLAGSADPYSLLARVRAQGPVLRGPGSWIVTGHSEAMALLRHPAGRSGFISTLYQALLPEGAARDEMAHRINFLDPPDHTRVRKLVGKAFTPRRVEGLRPYVAALAGRLLDDVAGRDRFDLVQDFAHQVPALVISELLGAPTEDRDHLTVLADRVSALLGLGSLDEDRKQAAVAAAEEIHAWLRTLVARRREDPADDLLCALLAAEDEGERLTEPELLSLAATLYSAGHRTTRDLFCNGMATLLGHPRVMERVRDGRLAATAVIEEFLRFETPTHYVARMLAEPAEIGGVTLPAGEPITVVLASANRDERLYAHADRFDPDRWLADPPPASPLSFAFGPHFCIGASLARLEARVMLETLLARMPGLRLADGVDPAALPWRHTGLFRSLETLQVSPR
jgi:cytochrome P450